MKKMLQNFGSILSILFVKYCNLAGLRNCLAEYTMHTAQSVTLLWFAYQRWADIDFLTPDPYPINFWISISNPYPKVFEI